MVKCTFCGETIKAGTGTMLVLNNGKILNFCKKKCEVNMLELKRRSLKVKWTDSYKKGE